MGSDVTAPFAVRDTGWSRAAGARLSALGLTADTVNKVLSPAANQLHETGESAVEAYGNPEVWATEQVNKLAEQGALQMRPLPWESRKHWMHMCCLVVASVYGTFGALQLFGFIGGSLSAAWILVGGFLGFCAALGVWGQYLITPHSPAGGWLLSGAGAVPAVFATVALWFTGPFSPGIDTDTVFWGLLDRTLQSETWAAGPGISTIWWLLLAAVLVVVSSPWKLWQARNLFTTLQSKNEPKPSVLSSRELPDWLWKGKFRRLAYYRWHLPPGSISQLEKHFVREPTPESLHKTHGCPAQALAWTAPVYRQDPACADHDWFEPRHDLGPLVASGFVAGVFVLSQISEQSAPWWVIALAVVGFLASVALALVSRTLVHKEFSLQRFVNATRKNDPVTDFYHASE